MPENPSKIKRKRSVISQLTDTPRKGTFTLAIGSFLIVLFMILVAIRPAISSVIKQISSNKERRELITQQEYKLKALKRLIDDKNRYQSEIDLLDDLLPNFDDVEFIVQNLFTYTGDSDSINIDSVEFDFYPKSKEVIDPNVENINATINFECDIDQATQFVQYLDKFPRIINVKKVDYASNEEENAVLPISGRIDVEIYYKLKQESPLDE
ncbi:hypothetical protein GF362_01300 [Candidatus Dojkabacteria bacterium]|nr:hypothetical protein [Candidatus Dojkabacteria bacterium]